MFNYWGKTDGGEYHLLAYHTLDVAACAVQIVRRSDRIGKVLERLLKVDRESAANLMGWAASVHDLGKLSPTFQRQDEATNSIADVLSVGPTSKSYDVRHDSLGWALWLPIQAAIRMEPKKRMAAEALFRCATGHHGKPPVANSKSGTRIDVNVYFGESDQSSAIEWYEWSTRFFNPEFPKSSVVNNASWWIVGLITLADWIGSNRDWHPFRNDVIDREAYFKEALFRADVALSKSGILVAGKARSYKEIYPAYTPTHMQQAVIDLPTHEGPFFLAIEETTGGGKTEAAIAAAGGSNFFFGLPTMATTNGLWRRVGVLDGQQTLIHGKSWLMPGSMDRASAWMADSSRKALLSDIGVGTIDQAMIGVMYSRYGTLRLAGLAGKTLIVDEVHAYDTYMKQIIEVLIEMQSRTGGSVILLSATMPLSHRLAYAKAWARGAGLVEPVFKKFGFPLVSFINSKGSIEEIDDLQSRYQKDGGDSGRRLSILHSANIGEVSSKVRSEASSGKCVAWIRNTVAEATEAYLALKAAGENVSLFHSRFVSADRAKIEKEVLDSFGPKSQKENRAGRILVATQVIEQSLDIDFDFMVTDLCPIDMLIQRAGRLHRHDRGDRGTPTMMVLGPIRTDRPGASWVSSWSRNSGFVYKDHSKLWLTQRLIADGFSLPADARKLVEGVYAELSEEDIPKGLLESNLAFLGEEISRESGGQMASISPDAAFESNRSDSINTWDDSQAPTRLGDPSKEWVVFENGFPISGDKRTSSIQVPLRSLSSAPGQDNKEFGLGKYQSALNLFNGSVKANSEKKRVTVSYDSTVGLVIRGSDTEH